MKVIDQLERRFGRFAVKNLTTLLVAAQCVGLAIYWFLPAEHLKTHEHIVKPTPAETVETGNSGAVP